jgi:hypothetical protein
MKPLLFSFLILASIDSALAQCSVDLSAITVGVAPAVLQDACVGESYNQVVQLVLKNDTVIAGQTTPFDSIQIEVLDLPTGLSLECNTSTCTVIGIPGQLNRMCFTISGVPEDITGLSNVISIQLYQYVTIFGSTNMLWETWYVGLDVHNADASFFEGGTGLTANATSGNLQWLDCDSAMQPIVGETNNLFNAYSGNIALEVTDGSCVNISSCFYYDPLSILETEAQRFAVYPNPSSGNFRMGAIGPDYMDAEATIADCSGKVVWSKRIDGSQATTVITDVLSKGMYLMTVKTKNGALPRYSQIVIQ